MNIKKYIKAKRYLFTIVFTLLTSCTTFAISDNRTNSINSTQSQIVMSAINSTSMKYADFLYFSKNKFNNDCSGLIYGIYSEAGIDLISIISQESGNGVKRLYTSLKKRDLLHKNKLPNIGDLIFWNNTYGKWGENPLSHAGVVIDVDKSSGDITYIHNNTYLGKIQKDKMNLFSPQNKDLNSYMRYDSKYKKTAGELFDSFGMAWRL